MSWQDTLVWQLPVSKLLISPHLCRQLHERIRGKEGSVVYKGLVINVLVGIDETFVLVKLFHIVGVIGLSLD